MQVVKCCIRNFLGTARSIRHRSNILEMEQGIKLNFQVKLRVSELNQNKLCVHPDFQKGVPAISYE